MSTELVQVQMSPVVQRVFDDLIEASPRLAAAGINRTARGVSAEAVRQTTAIYNLKQSALRRYMFVKQATKTNLTSHVTLRVRAIPIEEFGPRVEMRSVVLRSRAGRSFSRKLPFILVQRLRAESPQVVEGAFPLHQRTNGALRRGEVIRRRIGAARDRLTRIKYFNFPREWLNQLIPKLIAFGGQRLHVELDAAYRTALGKLKRN